MRWVARVLGFLLVLALARPLVEATPAWAIPLAIIALALIGGVIRLRLGEVDNATGPRWLPQSGKGDPASENQGKTPDGE